MEIVGLVRNDSPMLGVGYALQDWFGIRFAVSGVDKRRKLDFRSYLQVCQRVRFEG